MRKVPHQLSVWEGGSPHGPDLLKRALDRRIRGQSWRRTSAACLLAVRSKLRWVFPTVRQGSLRASALGQQPAWNRGLGHWLQGHEFLHHLRSRGSGSPLAQQPDGPAESRTSVSLMGTRGAPDTQEPGCRASAGQPLGAALLVQQDLCARRLGRRPLQDGHDPHLHCSGCVPHPDGQVSERAAARPTRLAHGPAVPRAGAGGTALRLAGNQLPSTPASESPPRASPKSPLKGPSPRHLAWAQHLRAWHSSTVATSPSPWGT